MPLMEMLRHLLCSFFGVLALTVLVSAQDQSSFISIDCGIPENASYTDAMTGLNYISDASFIDTGIIKNITEFNADGIHQQQLNVRSFAQGDRNCYNVSVTKGNKYLIRASFMYGNYDGLNKLPDFDLHLGPNKWVNVKILNASIPVNKEIVHIITSDYIHVCLVNTGSGTPFISALEFRTLKNSSYETQSGSLGYFTRLDVGSITNQTVRYPDDVYDRLWTPDHFFRWADISTSETIDSQSQNAFQPPSIAMRSAGIPTNDSAPMELYIDTEDTTLEFYAYMHFAEIVKLEANQSRHFNISLNGKFWSAVTPDYLYTTTVYSPSALTGGEYRFLLFKAGGSTLPPLLNAIEIYYVVQLPQLPTEQGDVDAITNIKSAYRIKSNWQGDPCAPQAYVWKGLNCSYRDTASPRIISLDLSSRGLIGEIASDIASLKLLESLDLSHNNLTGTVPDFLSQMPSLKSLNLTGNNLTGTIPVELYERSQKGLLTLSVDGNPDLCPSSPCKKKKSNNNIVAPVVASVAAIFVLVGALATILWILKRRKQQVTKNSYSGNVETETNTTRELLEEKRRPFTYSEVLQMTNNFQRVLGKGGFGTVYHGYLEDTQVAVKMLSPSSVQGYKEFQAEVKLLFRVHHRNLTGLVGYCNEGKTMGLIYEYMANGTLKDHLSDTKSGILSWEGRLRIGLEAAQGLEYLHYGCKPQIVHRDVKPTNILLNEKFQAKLADFGLSRTFPAEGGTHVSTIVAGTPGYVDPEYYVTNWLTEKSDVYSFGVVLLEMITGRPVIFKTHDHENTHISQWVGSLLEKGDVKSIVDPRLRGDCNINSVWKVVELAVACVSASSARRPTMNQVVIELKECLATEMARTGQGHSAQSNDSVELITVNVHTEVTPLAR